MGKASRRKKERAEALERARVRKQEIAEAAAATATLDGDASKVEAAPEQVDRAYLAAKPGPKVLQHLIHGDEGFVEPVYGIRIVRSGSRVLDERHRIRQFIRTPMKGRIAAEGRDHADEPTLTVNFETDFVHNLSKRLNTGPVGSAVAASSPTAR